MWEGISYEWSRLRSDVSGELALMVPKEDYNADPDEVLAAHYSDLEAPRFASLRCRRIPIITW